ncbi:hypothetical protein [Actinomadura sp. 9N407]|uniref:hypothetical protein n=1 Tax=Actinomadura sp. 9N407 TaxID=3375154 RepID=UPI0037AC891E
MITDLIVRAAAEESEAEYELERLADETPSLLSPHLPDLFAAGVLYPVKLYRTAGDDLQRAVVAMIDDGASELNSLLLILAHTRGPVAESAFRRWREQPPPGADELFIGPADYMREGGWILEKGRVRELCGQTAYSLEPDTDRTVEPPAQGECTWCRAPLWTVIDVDTGDRRVAEALAHTGWSGRLRIVTCQGCHAYTTVYSTVSPDGSSRLSDHSAEPIRILDDLSPPVTLRKVPKELLTTPDMSVGGWDMTVSSIGGYPGWIDDAEYPACPVCTRTMDYIGLEQAQDPEGEIIAEGTTYLFLDASCGLAATVYQQT